MTLRKIETDALSPVGSALHRPECVLATSDGVLHVADWRGGVTRIYRSGQQQSVLCKTGSVKLQPNGIALQRDGSYLLANLGDAGGVWQMRSDGSVRPVVTEVDGVTLPPTNFVLVDGQDRIWITVSTRLEPRARAYRRDIADGFIVLHDNAGTRVVADGLGYTNELQLHPAGDSIYVNETFARRTTRFALRSNGKVERPATVAEYGAGIFPDGLAFDERGGFWIVSIVSNTVLRVAPSGKQRIVVQNADPEHVAWVEQAYTTNEMGRQHLDTPGCTSLANISSIAFGGSDRRSCYLGCLLGKELMQFRSPIAGARPVHWDWRSA